MSSNGGGGKEYTQALLALTNFSMWAVVEYSVPVSNLPAEVFAVGGATTTALIQEMLQACGANSVIVEPRIGGGTAQPPCCR